MGNQHSFRAAPTELGGMGDAFCYRHIAPNGACNAPPRRPWLFNRATFSLCAQPRKLSGLDWPGPETSQAAENISAGAQSNAPCPGQRAC